MRFKSTQVVCVYETQMGKERELGSDLRERKFDECLCV